ncbi:hypothetical protein RI065_00440 [Mycoplasmatota bacterium zrk1]
MKKIVLITLLMLLTSCALDEEKNDTCTYASFINSAVIKERIV